MPRDQYYKKVMKKLQNITVLKGDGIGPEVVDQAIKVYNNLEKRTGIKETISMRKYKLYMRLGKEKKASQEIEETKADKQPVGLYEGMKSFIRRSDLSRDRAEQRPERFSVGDKVDVRVTNVDSKARRLGLSIKALEIAEEKEAVQQYGSSDSGASLGDILGAALKGGDE